MKTKPNSKAANLKENMLTVFNVHLSAWQLLLFFIGTAGFNDFLAQSFNLTCVVNRSSFKLFLHMRTFRLPVSYATLRLPTPRFLLAAGPEYAIKRPLMKVCALVCFNCCKFALVRRHSLDCSKTNTTTDGAEVPTDD